MGTILIPAYFKVEIASIDFGVFFIQELGTICLNMQINMIFRVFLSVVSEGLNTTLLPKFCAVEIATFDIVPLCQ